MVCDAKKPHAAHPYFRDKAAESRHLLPVFAQIAKESYSGTLFDQHICRCFNHLVQLDRLLDENSWFLDQHSAAKAKAYMDTALTSYMWLNQWALGHERRLFHQVPKFHMSVHLAEQAEFLNPRFSWTFKSEDYVGQISTIAHSVSPGVKSTRLSLKLCQKYRCCLHHRLSEGDFS
jgi:hypothetical protein